MLVAIFLGSGAIVFDNVSRTHAKLRRSVSKNGSTLAAGEPRFTLEHHNGVMKGCRSVFEENGMRFAPVTEVDQIKLSIFACFLEVSHCGDHVSQS